ncbi:hypothetical protein [Paenibacillus cisolokensis]|nr:hypothetical protein [Paenibacillus cisolokensis]
MKEISKKNMQVRYGQVILLIIESKYQQVWGIVKELLGVIASLQSHNSDKDHLQQIKTYLELFLQPTILIQTITAPKLEDFMRILREAYMKVALSQERHVQISISQSQNSTLKSNGDILIKKKASFSVSSIQRAISFSSWTTRYAEVPSWKRAIRSRRCTLAD